MAGKEGISVASGGQIGTDLPRESTANGRVERTILQFV